MVLIYLRVIWLRTSSWLGVAVILGLSQVYPLTVPSQYSPTLSSWAVSPLLTSFLVTALLAMHSVPEILGSRCQHWILSSRIPARRPMSALGDVAIAWTISSVGILALTGATAVIPSWSYYPGLGEIRSYPGLIAALVATVFLQFTLFALSASAFCLWGLWGSFVVLFSGLLSVEVLTSGSNWYPALMPSLLLPLAIAEKGAEGTQALWVLLHCFSWATIGFSAISICLSRSSDR